MANRALIAFLFLVSAALGQTPTPTPPRASPAPTAGIFPISNGKLLTPLDANGFQIHNLDSSNLPGGGGGGGGGGLTSITGDDGSATGLTLAITSPTSVLTDPVFTLGGMLDTAHGGTGQAGFTGAATITTLGTITTGVWQGTAIGASFLPALDSITAPAGNLSVNSKRVTNAADPISATDLANKQYVDGVANAGPPHPVVAAASTANLTRSGEQTIDGVTTSSNRVLLKDQTAGSENGIYVTAAGGWTRATDADTGAEVSGSVFVSGGTTQAGTTWGVTTPQPITINTTAVAYTLTGTSSVYTAAGGINLTGTQFSLAQMPAGTLKGNNSGSTAAPSDLTYATVKSAIGAESVLSFSAPLSRTTNAVSIPQATTSVAGYLAAADWNTFNSKIAPTRTLSATAPLRIGGISGAPGQDLSANRTFDMPAATNAVDGYLSAADHTTFNAKTPPDSTVALTNAGTTGTPSTWTSGATAATETQALSVDRFVLLPLSTGYSPGKRIVYSDNITTGNFGRWFRRNGSDLLNGGSADFRPFIAGALGAYGVKSIEFECIGGAFPGWQLVNSASTVFHVEDPVDASKNFNFSAALQTGSPAPITGVVTAANGNSVTVAPSDPSQPGVLRDIGSNGVPGKSQVIPSELLPVEDQIGTAGSNVTETLHPARNNAPFVNIIRMAGTLTAPLTLKWPSAANYFPGAPVTFVDSSGSVSSDTPVTVVAATGTTDTFAGAGLVTLDERNGQRTFISDGLGSWNVPPAKTSIQGFTVINPNGTTYVVNGNATAVSHHGTLNLQNGVNTLSVFAPYDGMDIDLFLVQPSSGAAATLNLPAVSKVSPGGAGVVSLTATNGAIDRLKGVYNLALNAFMWQAPILNHTAIAVPTAPSSLSATHSGSSTINLTWTDNSANEQGFYIYRAPGVSGTNFAQIFATAANATTFSDTNLSPSTGYNYLLRAFNSGGTSSSSNGSGDTTASGAPTAELWELHLNEGSGTTTAHTTGPDGNLSVANWTLAANTQSGTGSAFAPVLGIRDVPTPSASPVGTPGTTDYKYKVAAFRSATGTHGNLTANLDVPTGNAVLNGTNYNHIAWNAGTQPTPDYYEVYRTTVGAGGTGTTGRLNSTNITGTGFDDTGVATTGTIPPSPTNDQNTITAASPIVWGTQVISISFWAKATYTGPDSTNPIIDIDGGSPRTVSWVSGSKIQISFPGASAGTRLTGTVAVNVAGSGGNNINSGTAWHHIVIICDNSTATNTTVNGASDNIRVYFDGSATQKTVTYTVTTRAGAANFSTYAGRIGSTGFSGNIDDVRIFNRAINTTEIAALFSDGAK
jgi:Concanavalin A-like lectin/glucanases superfamily/Fibronectin type III domain